MSTRSGRTRQSVIDTSPSRVRKGVSPTRSPARSRKSSPPARTPRKSPSRKSPSRKPAPSPKYPARKSPSRTVKDSAEVEPEPAVPKSPAKRPSLKSNAVVKLEDVSAKYEIYRSTRSKRTEYSVRDYPSSLISTEITVGDKLNGLSVDADSEDNYSIRSRRSEEDVAPRRRIKLREIIESVPDIRRSFSKSLSKSISQSASESVSKSIDAFSDEENSEEEIHRQKEKSRSISRKLATPLPTLDSLKQTGKYEFGGRVGSAALIILIPLTVLATLIACTKSCSHKILLDSSVYPTLKETWINKQMLILVASQYILQTVFILLPTCGKRVEKVDVTGRRYCFNAFFAAFCTANFLFALDFFKILNMNEILSSFLGLACISYIFSVILALILYVKPRQLNENDLNAYGNTGYAIYDYVVGREIYPYIKKLNVKIWISRISNVTALILTVIIFKHGITFPTRAYEDLTIENYKNFYTQIQFKPTVLLFAMMQMIYVLNFILKEYQITGTFYWQSEGAGYLQIVGSALYPFYFASISKYVLDTNLTLSTNVLIAASVLYILGLLIMVMSNNIKYEFRRNPLQPSVARLDSMPTFLGKKLLVSNLWGVLRHPNYTGDILIQVSLALPGIVSQHILAAAPAIITILVLLHRSWRDHERCKRRYGAAWHRYCKRVPSVIVPKIL